WARGRRYRDPWPEGGERRPSSSLGRRGQALRPPRLSFAAAPSAAVVRQWLDQRSLRASPLDAEVGLGRDLQCLALDADGGGRPGGTLAGRTLLDQVSDSVG